MSTSVETLNLRASKLDEVMKTCGNILKQNQIEIQNYSSVLFVYETKTQFIKSPTNSFTSKAQLSNNRKYLIMIM